MRPASESVTVSVHAGATRRAAGRPWREDVPVCAVVVLTSADLDSAVDLAASYPMATVGVVEVREVWEDLA
jgi:hypothetical protein